MFKYIHNLTQETLSYQGRSIEADEYYKIPSNLYLEFADDAQLEADIINNVVALSRDGITDIASKDNAIHFLKLKEFRSSIAVDKNGINQQVSGTAATVVVADRVLWDLGEDYDVGGDHIDIPYDGIYSFDCQIKLTNITNCSFIELAIYKKLENGQDYWFILDRKPVGTATELQMNGATQFDFYKGEQYDLRILLTKSLPLLECSCTISGDDDYTAWGLNLSDIF